MSGTMILNQINAMPALGWLVIVSKETKGTVFTLAQGDNEIGREVDEDNAILIKEDMSVSKRHALIRVEENKFTLYDLASINGTFLNNEKISVKELNDEDEVKIGETEFVFKKINNEKYFK